MLADIRATGRVGECAEALLRFRSDTYNRIWSTPEAPLHDPIAIAMMIDASIVRCQDTNVEIELRGQFTRGATVIDLTGATGRPANARVAISLDIRRFWQLMISALQNLAVPPR